MQMKASGTTAVDEAHLKTRRGALVGLQDATDLTVNQVRIEPLARALNARGQTRERGLDAHREFLVHRALLGAPLGRATQNDRIVSLEAAGELDLDPLAQLAPTVGGGERGRKLLQ